MSLKDDLEQIEKDNDPQVTELRKALVHTQKQLAKIKNRQEEITEAVSRAVYEAMLAMGPVKPVEAPKFLKTKAKAEVALLLSLIHI